MRTTAVILRFNRRDGVQPEGTSSTETIHHDNSALLEITIDTREKEKYRYVRNVEVETIINLPASTP